jgi:hypothetical protein
MKESGIKWEDDDDGKHGSRGGNGSSGGRKSGKEIINAI